MSCVCRVVPSLPNSHQPHAPRTWDLSPLSLPHPAKIRRKEKKIPHRTSPTPPRFQILPESRGRSALLLLLLLHSLSLPDPNLGERDVLIHPSHPLELIDRPDAAAGAMGSLTRAEEEETAAAEEWSGEAVVYVNGVRRVLPDGLAHLTLLQYLRGPSLYLLNPFSFCMRRDWHANPMDFPAFLVYIYIYSFLLELRRWMFGGLIGRCTLRRCCFSRVVFIYNSVFYYIRIRIFSFFARTESE